MPKKVEIIEPTKTKKADGKKYNVCAYARVSTDSDEQKDSFLNQQRYYEDKIRNNPTYNFVGVFADEAISGTTDKRPNFQRMIRLAEQGYIDIILTKSISRFSRNVGDLQKYCEILRNHNVNLIFEENGIELLNSSGSLLLTILGAIAQMEVENTSDHINWTLTEKMKKGELVGQANPLGYDVVDNKLVVNEEEAETVRYIFRRYLDGVGTHTIAKELTSMGAKTKKRNNTVWHDSTVVGILKNEKYTGELVQGKTYTVNPIGHIRRDNNGEAHKYIIKDNHEAIISTKDFEKVKALIASRSVKNKDGKTRGTTSNTSQSEFTSKLVCAYCGKHYVKRTTHPGTKYSKIKWSCATVGKRGKAMCPNSVIIDDDYLKQSIVGMIKNLIDDEDSMFYLTTDKLNDLLKQSDKDRDIIEQQIIQCRKNIDLKTKKKARILDMYLDEKISEEEFISQRADIDKQIAAIQETLNELESLYGMEDVKQNSSKQICKLISEGKAEGFNKELFDLIVKQIVIGGKRSDGVDDPKSLHYELINYNLNTDMKKVVRKGILYYTMDIDMEKAMEEENGKKKEINDVYSFYSDHTCGDCVPFGQPKTRYHGKTQRGYG